MHINFRLPLSWLRGLRCSRWQPKIVTAETNIQTEKTLNIANNNTPHVAECTNTIEISNNLLFQSVVKYAFVPTITQSQQYSIDNHHYYFSSSSSSSFRFRSLFLTLFDFAMFLIRLCVPFFFVRRFTVFHIFRSGFNFVVILFMRWAFLPEQYKLIYVFKTNKFTNNIYFNSQCSRCVCALWIQRIYIPFNRLPANTS